uniref:Uncharacterized protein n=1 Tax=Kalanchoe fedtschenkoi TaxID=63787 RepID=A0A7N1A2E8_KALFE
MDKRLFSGTFAYTCPNFSFIYVKQHHVLSFLALGSWKTTPFMLSDHYPVYHMCSSRPLRPSLDLIHPAHTQPPLSKQTPHSTLPFSTLALSPSPYFRSDFFGRFRSNTSPLNSPSSYGSSSTSINPLQTPPLAPKAITRSDPSNLYPTTFVQADTAFSASILDLGPQHLTRLQI